MNRFVRFPKLKVKLFADLAEYKDYLTNRRQSCQNVAELYKDKKGAEYRKIVRVNTNRVKLINRVLKELEDFSFLNNYI